MRYQGIQFPDIYLKLTIRYDLCFVRWLPSNGGDASIPASYSIVRFSCRSK
jgi:hypothetical protein